MATKKDATRRQFLAATTSAASLAAISKLSAAETSSPGVHTGVDETLRVGLVGCGGRGKGAVVDALKADPHTKLVAVGDVFADQARAAVRQLSRHKEVGSRVAVEPDHEFTDFENYRQVIDACDVVLLATPPHFRPQHLEYAVQQGKHVFVEKPVAVDAPGVRQVEAACRLAKEKQLAIVSGLCWRYVPAVQETIRRVVEEKQIGEIIAIESSYNAGTLWHRGDNPDWSRMEYQLRNWLYYTWLSGDHINEQAVHSLDKTAWLLGDTQPTLAMALGGRQQRTQTEFGHVYDHFTVFYEYPTGQRVYFTCRQQKDTTTHVDETVLGTAGQAEILANTITPKSGDPWKYTGPKVDMYLAEHQAMFASIRSGEPINNGHYMCNSTMLAIMGRMAAYTGKTLTWDECYNDTTRLGPAQYSWTDLPEPEVAIPGKPGTLG